MNNKRILTLSGAVAGAIGILLSLGDLSSSESRTVLTADTSLRAAASLPNEAPAAILPVANRTQQRGELATMTSPEILAAAPLLRRTLQPAALTSPADKEKQAKPNRDDNQAKAMAKMSGRVAAMAALGGSELVDIVVRYDQHPELFDDAIVAELGGQVTRGFQSLAMRAIQLPASALIDLAIEENVDWLSSDDPVSSFSVASRDAANLPSSSSANAVYSGSNVGIAVIDTGVSTHADLGQDIMQYSFLGGNYPTPEIVDGEIVDYRNSARTDGFGHGTHVAGILSGSGNESGDQYKGSAKGSKLLALQVLDKFGAGSMSDVMAALDWLLVYGEYFDIRVVNLSLGMGIAESNQTDPLVLAVERLWDAGMVVVVAAGNEGHYGSMTVTSPGNSRKVITVGSLTDGGTGDDTSDDYVSTFSSRGPTISDLVLKPDLLAPGNRLVATTPHNSKMLIDLPGRSKSCTGNGCAGNYLELSGTSLASPMVSAAVALMLDKDPTLSPATIKARLMRSARKITAEPTEAGAGVLDIDAALSDTGVVSGDALSPLLVPDESTGGILVEDTADLWGDSMWGAGYLFSGGFDWVDGYAPTGEGVSANGFLWTDGEVFAKGFLWTDGEVMAKGFLWTDSVGAQSFLDDAGEAGMVLNDDAPVGP